MSAAPGPGRTPPLAMITGVSRAGRVGHAIARRFWLDGFDLVLTYRGEPSGVDAIIADLGPRPGQAVRAEAVNLDDPASVEALARGLSAELPALDVLVHNASLYEPTPLRSVSVATLERMLRVNTLAPLLLTRGLQAALERSTLAGGAAVIAMLDIHALGELGQPRTDFVAYGLSKAALHELVLILARELAPRVRVNGVAPGVVAFPVTGTEADPAMQARYLARVPLARSGTPDEAAAAVAWLARGATYCTGQVVRVDGGRAIT